MMKKVRLMFFILLSSLSIPFWAAQPDSTGTSVSVSSIIKSKQVPLNRTVEFTVRIAWSGNIETVEMGDLTDPILSNLDVVGTASSNNVTGIPGGQESVKEVVYTLQPKNLGMAYIEPVSLSYTDKKTNLVHYLRTRRMSLEVVSPVPEPKGGPGLWFWILLIAAFTAGITIGGWFYIRQRKLKMIREALPAQVILEEDFLKLLKDTVDLKGKDRKESFATLSRLFRKYLSEKYGIAASGATTQELMGVLRERGTDEALVRKCELLFAKADVIKFSGTDAAQAELDEAYTTVETVLESRLNEERTRLEQEKAEAESSKSGKFKFLRFKKKK